MNEVTYRSAYPIFKLFIQKANRLEESSFLESLIKEFRLGISYEVNKPLEITSIRPQRESIDAFVLTFRFFIQDNEATSIRNLRKIFNTDVVTIEEKDEYDSLRSDLSDFLLEYANLTIKEDKPTNGEIMDTVLFGDLSHANKNKKKKFDLWMNGSELLRECIWHKFIISIIEVVNVVRRIKNMIFKIISRNIIISGKLKSQNYGRIQFDYTVTNYNAVKLIGS